MAALVLSAGNSLAAGTADISLGQLSPIALPTGQSVTPTLAPMSTLSTLNPGLPAYPNLTVGQAISLVLSHDNATLAVLTTGYNKYKDEVSGKADPNLQNEYVFIFDVSHGKPLQKQVLQVPNTYAGLVFSPDDKTLYVSGGKDDSVHTFSQKDSVWSEAATAIKLAHAASGPTGLSPVAAGLDVTADGSKLVVANLYNDSVSVIDVAKRAVTAETDLRPGKSGGASGTAGGNYPFWVSIKGNDTAYVSSVRDREVVVLDIASGLVKGRIALNGNPNKMILNKAQDKLFVALDNTDSVAVINTQTHSLLSNIGTLAPPGLMLQAKAYGGAAPNSLSLSADERTLYVTNNGTNSVAVISMTLAAPVVIGLLPTAWSPQAVMFNPNGGGMLYVINSKSVPGPNPGWCLGYGAGCPTAGTPVKQGYNQYVLQLSKAGFQTLPAPTSPAILSQLTRQVAINNSFNYASSASEASTMAFLNNKIKHVIYIVRENRTYDQVLGDLGKGNGDPRLTEFGKNTTPNQHALASQLVTLDNFYDPAEVSGNGWPWSTSARESDFGVKMLPPNYAGRGGAYEWEGANRNIGMGNTGATRFKVNPNTPDDPDFLPGTGNVAAPDGPNGELQKGYLWNAALRAGLTVRNYGFFVQNSPTSHRTPFASGVPQAAAIDPDLVDKTDIYFRGYDTAYPEFYREVEWEREFDQFVASGKLPALSLVRFGTDHTGSFKTALDGVNTPELQVAANDYAIGKLVEAVARSRYSADTLIFVVEDDCQDGPDHVDEHRSIAFVAGPYVKQGAVVSTRYSTVNMLRTIEDVLGMDHLSINDHNQGPMTEVFDTTRGNWTFTATIPPMLRSSKLPLVPASGVAATIKVKPRNDVRYWVAATRGFDFSKEDLVDAEVYNRVLWRGIMGSKPYPSQRSGVDLSPKVRNPV
jgi:6-phosphogluconolactonase (cycloisomerase 2 family)